MFTHHELMNRIELEVRSNYGNEAIYVVSSHASAVRTLTGKKTISRQDIEALTALGHTFAYSIPELKGLAV